MTVKPVKMLSEKPRYAGVLYSVRRLFKYRPFADRVLCHLLKKRLALPELTLSSLFDGFEESEVVIRGLPKGGWSTPIADVVMLLKLVVCARPARLMEVGSFRGYTALALAQHVEDNARIVTVDRYSEHGEAYRDTSFAARIERRVGETGERVFSGDAAGSYDLIFLDADHAYEGVRHDTECILPLVAPKGYLVWHDYANWGFFNGYNGVPEYLKELVSQGLSIARIAGSDLAIHSPSWDIEGSEARARYQRALRNVPLTEVGADPWNSELVRG